MTDLVTIGDARTECGTNASQDAELSDLVSAATPVIEDMVGPVIAGTRTRTFDGGSAAVLLPSAVTAVTSVTEGGSAITDYTPNLAAGIIYAGQQLAPRTFLPGTQNIVVTYTAGTAADETQVPANIKRATLELIRFWWQVGQQGNRPGFGDAPEAEIYTPSGFAVPRRVAELCGPNPRMPGFA